MLKKTISLIGVMLVVVGLVGCSSKEPNNNGFTLYVDVEKSVSNIEDNLRNYTRIPDLNVNTDSDHQYVFVDIPVSSNINAVDLKKKIYKDDKMIKKIVKFYNDTEENIHAINPLCKCTVYLTIYNKENNDNIIQIFSKKEITNVELKDLLKSNL